MMKFIQSRFDLFNLIIFGVFATLIIRYQIQLLTYLEWGDETANIVTSKLIYAGKTLFSQIHELHGPLSYLPGLIVEQFGDFGVRGHRIPIAILQWLALISLYFSPLLKRQNFYLKLSYCVAAATVMVIYFADLFGSTYLFQVMAGLFFVIILAQYTLPAIADPLSLNKFQVFIGNVLILSLPFLAITYIPISIALFIVSWRKQFKQLILVSALFGLIGNLLFLTLIASIPGYFAMHFWINAFISRKYVEGVDLGLRYLLSSSLSSITSDLARFSIFLLLTSGLATLAHREKNIPWRSFVLGLGIASLLIRSMGFQGLPLLYLFLSIPLVFFHALPKLNRSSSLFLSPILIVCFIKLALLNPANISDRQIATESEFSKLVKLVTNKNDRIIAWPFENREYILADRLPASGNFFYLPWQRDYYANPKFGINIDSCEEFKTTSPKIMLINPYPFGGVDWQDYIPACVLELIKTNYTQIPNTAYYLRKDIYQSYKPLINQ